MKFTKALTAIIICISLIILPSCAKLGSFSNSDSVLKIGIPETEGNYNPFYSTNKSDLEVVAQMFRPIQRRGADNKLVNHSGGISYEFVGDSQVKYTISIKDDMFFSDGTNITIDDVISFYHFIADASYNGTYSDFYLNDISGIKEYYFDDKNYQKSISNIENKIASQYTLSTISNDNYVKYLKDTMLEGKYDGNPDSLSPSKVSWMEYVKNSAHGYKLSKSGSKISNEDFLTLLAEVEADINKFGYNPEDYYREKLYSDYINENYADGINVATISGIKKVNDYTCTVLFNSRNINDISQLNIILVPTNYLFAEYIKGSAGIISEIRNIAVSSGPYVLGDYDEKEITMSANSYYTDGENEFKNLKFCVVDDLVKSLLSEKVDIISTDASAEVLNKIKDDNFSYTVTNKPSYISVCYNTRSLDDYARTVISYLCADIITIEDVIGPYYTKLQTPMSIRFSENLQKPVENTIDSSSFELGLRLSKTLDNLKAYYCGSEDDLNYITLNNLKNKLSQNGIDLEIVLCDTAELENAVISGNADLWLSETPDNATCDRYDDYNSAGKNNKTGLNNALIDDLTISIRQAVGYTDKSESLSNLMNAVMECNVEYPLYQLQTVTVYNTNTIDEKSIEENKSFDGYTYIIPWLTQQKG